MNKKIVISVICLLILSVLALAMVTENKVGQTKDSVKDDTLQSKAPPEIIGEENVQTPTLSAEDEIGCDQSSKEKYGGINKDENNPPKGTHVDEILTKNYGRTTATGVCGTYTHISGWWFSAAEMRNLPIETLQYGQSPYVTTEGSDSNSNSVGEGEIEDPPITPVPEPSTIILVIAGILMMGILIKRKK